MRTLALLILLFGPLLSAPAAAGLWTWARLVGTPYAELYAIAAGVLAALVVAGLVRRRGLVREASICALSIFWAGWLWLAMTDDRYDWTDLPQLRAPDRLGRMAVILIVLVYLMFYVVAEHTRPKRVR